MKWLSRILTKKYKFLLFQYLGILFFVFFTSFIWKAYIIDQLLTSNKKSMQEVQSLQGQWHELQAEGNISADAKLTRQNLTSEKAMINTIQHIVEMTGGASLLGLKKNNPPADALKNLQIATSFKSSLSVWNYELRVKGSYAQLLIFIESFSKEKSFFTNNIDYRVDAYPEAIMTINFSAYGRKSE